LLETELSAGFLGLFTLNRELVEEKEAAPTDAFLE
jgi:hypothetical protein